MVGVLYGEMNEEGIHQSVKSALRYCGMFCGSLCVLFLVFSRQIAMLYITDDSELLKMTTFAICMIAIQAPLERIKIFPNLEDYLDLPGNFRKHPGDLIDLDVRDLEDVSLTSEQIKMFCKGHKIDDAIGFKAALCFEELIIRIQDNCPSFDVERQIAMTVSDSSLGPEEKIGLKIVGSMASDIKYVHSLETNNVILRFPTCKQAKFAEE